ncbi:hypothetical protein HPB51_017814 [Rhipicephalus microplus]|uniref:Secreted protein n=1 Tax=Rhipicephalus microplus TaxID=6941 RepID=A0A9J6DW32_RHIMP|nr:hypothetical protein HPB51_017814 [Rhipicephalus microplus]
METAITDLLVFAARLLVHSYAVVNHVEAGQQPLCRFRYVVINLEVCVVMSHHHCSASKLTKAWPKLTRGNKKLERAWFEALRRRRPELAVLVPQKQKRRSRDSYSDTKTGDSSATSCSSDVDKDGSDEADSDNS